MDKKEKEIRKKEIYSGKVISLSVSDIICPNGNLSTREIVHHRGGVSILAEIDNKIAFVKQFRFPYQEEVIELPAGKLEKGELPLDAAKRELEEEIGYIANEFIFYGEIYPSPGYTDEKLYLYVAKDLHKTITHYDDDEFIDIVYLDKGECLSLIKENKIKDAKTIILLLRYLFNNK